MGESAQIQGLDGKFPNALPKGAFHPNRAGHANAFMPVIVDALRARGIADPG